MAKKNNYKALDDIGFIGVDTEVSERKRTQEVRETSDFIRRFQSDKISGSLSRNRKHTIGRTKRSGSTVPTSGSH